MWSSESRRRAAGFSLIEAIVASTILGLGILGVVRSMSACLQTASRSARTERAVDIASREMTKATAGIAEFPDGSEGIYHWSVTYEDRPHGLVRVSVRVVWPEGGRQEALALSQIFRPPDQQEEP